jgi:hypothetical protein
MGNSGLEWFEHIGYPLDDRLVQRQATPEKQLVGLLEWMSIFVLGGIFTERVGDLLIFR